MPSANQEVYSSWVGLIYVFNIIVGTGALTLPAVFKSTGWLLSTILIIALAFVSFVTVTFIIEAIACANATMQLRKIQSHKIDGESETAVNSESDEDNINETTAIIGRTRQRYYNLNQKVELGEMARLYFNKTGRILFYISLCIYLYGDLTIYATAIGKTLTDLTCNNSTDDNFQLPCGEWSNMEKIGFYRIYVAIFFILIGPFTYFNVQKTKYLQIVTSTMRWVAFSIMIIIASVRLVQNGPEGTNKTFDFTYTPALIGASVYSFMCHHSLPGLVAPFVNKQYVIRQLALDYILICLFYLLLALTGSFAFEKLYDLYTLNFVPNALNQTGAFMEVIEYYLGLFPIFTLSTSFPIIAITLQNNLKSLFLDIDTLDRYNFVLRRLTFPTLAVAPALIISLFTHNINYLVAFTGSYGGAVIQYIIPACLVWSARRHCKRDIGSNTSNKFASPFRSTFWVVFILGWCFLCIILVTVNLSLQYAKQI